MQREHNTIFIFAHQDDELAVYHEIESVIGKGGRVTCLYLTNGEWAGVSKQIRKNESLSILRSLKVPEEDIHFIGDTIKSGDLVLNINETIASLSAKLQYFRDARRLIIHAWEGGHEDHDVAHYIGVWLAHTLGLMNETFQFPLYRSSGNRFLFYKVISPIPQNGEVYKSMIPLKKRFVYLMLLFKYKSQLITMCGLLPFLLLQYAYKGEQLLQSVRKDRLFERPHIGKLLYEIRGRSKFEIVFDKLKPIRNILSKDC